MSKHKWAPGDWAMLPVRLSGPDEVDWRAFDEDGRARRNVRACRLRPCDPPGHGPHLDAAKLLYKIGLMRGSALCWCDNAHRQGYLEALDEMETKVRAAIAAQGADDER